MSRPHISISDFRNWMTCEYAYQVRAQHKRWTPPTAPMQMGTAFHKCLEHKWVNTLTTEVIEEQLTLLKAAWSELSPVEFRKIERPMTALRDVTLPPFKVLGVELPLKMPILTPDGEDTGTDLVGRLDALLETEDGLKWSGQGKTIDAAKPVASESLRVRDSFYEIAYHALCSYNGIELAGTFCLIGVKMSDKAFNEGRSPLFYEFEERSHDQYCMFWAGLRDRLARSLLTEEAVFHNTESCLGPNGNSPCPLFAHCHQGSDLRGIVDTALTHPLVDRYPEFS